MPTGISRNIPLLQSGARASGMPCQGTYIANQVGVQAFGLFGSRMGMNGNVAVGRVGRGSSTVIKQGGRWCGF